MGCDSPYPSKKKKMWSILSVVFYACTPQPASVSIEGAPENTQYTLAPITLPTANALSAEGEVLAQPVVWSVLTPDLASLSADGKTLTPTAEGEIIVSATAGEASQKLHITVAIPDSIAVTGVTPDHQLVVGDSLTASAQVLDGTNALPLPITWESSDAQIVSVVDGNVSALQAGDAVLSAVSGDLKVEIPVHVTAPVLTEVVPTEDPAAGL